MLNINKVRKIVKAYQGLQIPDGPMTLSNGNFNLVLYNIPSSISSISINSIDNPNPYMNGNSKATLIGNMIGQGSDFISNLFSADKDGYYGKYGSLLQTGDLAFDLAANTVMTINPLVGGIMKAGGLVSDVLITYGGMGTDSMTKKDAILGSKLLSLTPVGMVNGFFGKKSNTFSVNSDVVSKVGGSYSGSVKDFYDSASKANKKYGLFSNKERKLANNQIAESKDLLNTMEEISSNATDDFSTLQMSDINHIKYGINLNGGIDFRYKRYVKDGGQLTRIKKLQLHKIGGLINQSINLETKLIEDIPVNDTPIVATEIVEYQEGGPIIEWKPNIVLEEYLEGGTIKSRSLEDLIQYAKQQNPRFIQRMSEPVRDIEFVDKEGNTVRGTHYLEWSEDNNGNALVYPTIMEDDSGNLKYFGNDAYDRAILKKDFLIMTPKEAELFSNSGEDKDGNLYGYKKGWPDFFKSKFKNGGKTKELDAPKIEETNLKNIIPEGALHKNKHHMDNSEGLTLKGIPVIDNLGELLAEIEKNEIIFTLEVTKKLEELMKEGTDEAAIQAGKLLVKEILFNTDDRTLLIDSIK